MDRFEVIEPPRAGFEPTAPMRPLLAVGVLLFGIIAGAGVAYLLNMMRPVFSRARQLSEITGMPVLGVVSMTWLERYEAQASRTALVFGGAAAALLVLAGLFVLLQHSLVRSVQGWLA